MQWAIIENCEKKRKLSSVIKSPGKFPFLQTLIFFSQFRLFYKNNSGNYPLLEFRNRSKAQIIQFLKKHTY